MRLVVLILAAAILAAAATPTAAGGQYEFLAAPQINLSLVYRLDKLPGDVIACPYTQKPEKTQIEPGAFGGPNRFRRGGGRTKKGPGDYGPVPPRPEQGGGVFR